MDETSEYRRAFISIITLGKCDLGEIEPIGLKKQPYLHDCIVVFARFSITAQPGRLLQQG